ncbi:hypothetical protein INR49_010293 [Caranx melampygus]|nr:hypothetical protein INR49_010293 [Caranx melampygus]
MGLTRTATRTDAMTSAVDKRYRGSRRCPGRTHLGHTYCPADLQFPSWPVGAVEGGPCESSGRSARRLQRQQCDCFLLYMSAVSGEQLKRSLYALFSQFGQIIDIVAMKTMRMRGQAFVVFKELTAATNALRQLQGFPFYNKPMRIQYAKTDSEVIAKVKGTYGDKEKKKEKKKKAQEPAANLTKKPAVDRQLLRSHLPSRSQTTPQLHPVPQQPAGGDQRDDAVHAVQPVSGAFAVGAVRLVFRVNNAVCFRQVPGFKEVRLVPGKHDIAFVEFESDTQAGVAKDALQGFRITATCAMKITYAKK